MLRWSSVSVPIGLPAVILGHPSLLLWGELWLPARTLLHLCLPCQVQFSGVKAHRARHAATSLLHSSAVPLQFRGCHYFCQSHAFRGADHFAIWNCTRLKLKNINGHSSSLLNKASSPTKMTDSVPVSQYICLKCFLGTFRPCSALWKVDKDFLVDAMSASLTHTTQNIWRQFQDYFYNLEAYTNTATCDSGQIYLKVYCYAAWHHIEELTSLTCSQKRQNPNSEFCMMVSFWSISSPYLYRTFWVLFPPLFSAIFLYRGLGRCFTNK